MTAPTPRVRELTYQRDKRRCVSCGATNGLQWQHRSSSGSGGRGRKAPALTAADGVTSCGICNPRYESDLQDKALALGWKLRRFRMLHAWEVPFWDVTERAWFLPDVEGNRKQVLPTLALELIEAAGGTTRRLMA